MRRAMIAVAALICAATTGCFFPLMPARPPVVKKGSGLHAFASVENLFPAYSVIPLSWGWIWAENGGKEKSNVVYIKALRKDNPNKTPEVILTVPLKHGGGFQPNMIAGASDSEACLLVKGGWYRIALDNGKAKLGAFTHLPDEATSFMPVPLKEGRVLAGTLLMDGPFPFFSIVDLKTGKTEPVTLSGWSKFSGGTGGSFEAGKDRSAKDNAPDFLEVGSGVQVGDKLFIYVYQGASLKKAKSHLYRAKLDGGILESEASVDLPAARFELAQYYSGVYSSGGKVWLTYANTLYSVGPDLKLTKAMTSSRPEAFLSVSGSEVLELYEWMPLP